MMDFGSFKGKSLKAEDEVTNMSGASNENFKRRWNDDPISRIKYFLNLGVLY